MPDDVSEMIVATTPAPARTFPVAHCTGREPSVNKKPTAPAVNAGHSRAATLASTPAAIRPIAHHASAARFSTAYARLA
jgi:hypothetical protein